MNVSLMKDSKFFSGGRGRNAKAKKRRTSAARQESLAAAAAAAAALHVGKNSLPTNANDLEDIAIDHPMVRGDVSPPTITTSAVICAPKVVFAQVTIAGAAGAAVAKQRDDHDDDSADLIHSSNECDNCDSVVVLAEHDDEGDVDGGLSLSRSFNNNHQLKNELPRQEQIVRNHGWFFNIK